MEPQSLKPASLRVHAAYWVPSLLLSGFALLVAAHQAERDATVRFVVLGLFFVLGVPSVQRACGVRPLHAAIYAQGISLAAIVIVLLAWQVLG